MGHQKERAVASSRMGVLWTLAPIRDAVLIEFGCMGHLFYGTQLLERSALQGGCKIFSTHISELDIALGSYSNLKEVVKTVIVESDPKAIFLTPSAIPEMIGTDMQSVCQLLQKEHPSVLFLNFPSGGFDACFSYGVQETLKELIITLPETTEKSPKRSYNILGSCPDLFNAAADEQEIVRLMEGSFGLQKICSLSNGCCIEDIQAMGSAHINLVMRREALSAAIALQKRFGTPYVMVRPYGIQKTLQSIKQISDILQLPFNKGFIEKEVKTIQQHMLPFTRKAFRLKDSFPALSLGGHRDVVEGIGSFWRDELGLELGSIWCDDPSMGDEEIPYLSTQNKRAVLQGMQNPLLMESGDLLTFLGLDTSLQIAFPDSRWRLNPYSSPLLGFRGTLQLAQSWMNVLFGGFV